MVVKITMTHGQIYRCRLSTILINSAFCYVKRRRTDWEREFMYVWMFWYIYALNNFFHYLLTYVFTYIASRRRGRVIITAKKVARHELKMAKLHYAAAAQRASYIWVSK